MEYPFPDSPYCSVGQQLYTKLAETFMNLETGEDHAPELQEEMNSKGVIFNAELDEHFRTCPHCSTVELRFHKKRAVSSSIQ